MPGVGKEFIFCLLPVRMLKQRVEGLKPMGPYWLRGGADSGSRDLSVPRQDGSVLHGPRGGFWPRRGPISLLLCELNLAPQLSLPWLWDVVFIVGNFIAVAARLGDLPIPAPSSASLLTILALVFKTSQFRKLSRLKMRNLSFFSPSCSLPLWLFWNWGALVPDYTQL